MGPGGGPVAHEGALQLPLAAAEPGELAVTGSRPAGGIHALDQLWRRLGLQDAVRATLAGRRLSPETERAQFALVANRALAASSKLAAADWISGDVHVDGLPETSDDACYRAMDHLPEIEPGLAGQACYQLTDLLNLEVDLLFFDTASAYFETEQEDADVPRDERGERVPAGSKEEADQGGFRALGKPRDSRDDLPQVIAGMAVTRDGIPVRVWSWPGDTGDSGLIRARPGTTSGPSSSASTPSPGPAPPAPSARPPASPSRCATSTPHWLSNRRRRSSPWTPHPRPPDLREHQSLVTRPVTGPLSRSRTSTPIFRSLGGQSSAEPR